MAIQINVALTKAGVPIPTGSMIKANTFFADDIIARDEEGQGAITGKTRVLQMGFHHFPSRAAFQASPLEIGQVDQFPNGYGEPISDVNWALLSGPNALLVVEGWLKDWLENYLGAGTCTIVDPYA
jgi:hypothetical protein